MPDSRLAVLRDSLAAYQTEYDEIHLIADYENDVARHFAEPHVWTDYARALGEHALARASEAGEEIDSENWTRLADWTAPGRTVTRDMIRNATAAERAEDTEERRSERQAIRRALTNTARDIRASAAAARRAVDLVRPYLPDGRPERDAAALEAFLAAFDDEPAVRRATITRLYSEAGAPGDLDAHEFRAALSERWGRPVKRRGHVTYKPAEHPQH